MAKLLTEKPRTSADPGEGYRIINQDSSLGWGPNLQMVFISWAQPNKGHRKSQPSRTITDILAIPFLR